MAKLKYRTDFTPEELKEWWAQWKVPTYDYKTFPAEGSGGLEGCKFWGKPTNG